MFNDCTFKELSNTITRLFALIYSLQKWVTLYFPVGKETKIYLGEKAVGTKFLVSFLSILADALSRRPYLELFGYSVLEILRLKPEVLTRIRRMHILETSTRFVCFFRRDTITKNYKRFKRFNSTRDEWCNAAWQRVIGLRC